MEYNVQLLVDGKDKGYFHVRSVDDFHTLTKLQNKITPGKVYLGVGRYGDDLVLGDLMETVTNDWDIFALMQKLRMYLITATVGQRTLEGESFAGEMSSELADGVAAWLESRKELDHDHPTGPDDGCSACWYVDEAIARI